MKPPLFVDTGAFYARYVPRDQYHEISLSLWKKLGEEGLSCVTTNLVLVETISLFVYRFGHHQAVLAAREIYSSQVVEVVRVGYEDEVRALEWMEKFSDKRFSMTDATSFAMMERMKINRFFGFDSDFEVAGFTRFA